VDTPITVNFPPDLYQEIKRISDAENWPEEDAVILLVRFGAKVEKQTADYLNRKYDALVEERDPIKARELGDDLIRAVFKPDAIPPSK
jgi:hypothetical protein